MQSAKGTSASGRCASTVVSVGKVSCNQSHASATSDTRVVQVGGSASCPSSATSPCSTFLTRPGSCCCKFSFVLDSETWTDSGSDGSVLSCFSSISLVCAFSACTFSALLRALRASSRVSSRCTHPKPRSQHTITNAAGTVTQYTGCSPLS